MGSDTITLLAGAGFSRAVSEMVQYCNGQRLVMPLAMEMFEISENYFDKNDTNPNFKKYRDLDDYMEKHGIPKSESFESVYSELNKCNGYLANAVRDLVFEHLGVNYPPIRYPFEAKQTIEIIRKFLRKNCIQNIITTNPDILIDVAIMGATEFDSDYIEKYLNTIMPVFSRDPSILETNIPPVINKEDSSFSMMTEIKNYVKIHGSINYVKVNNNEKIIYLCNKYPWINGISTNTFIENNCGAKNLCVIAPLDNKDPEYKKSPWESLLKIAADILESTDKLLVFGFGFSENDKAFKTILNKFGQQKEISICDPNANKSAFKCSVKEFFKRGNDKQIDWFYCKGDILKRFF